MSVKAAHCIQEKGDSRIRHPQEIVLKLGRFDLSQKYEKGSIISFVSDIFIHPNWKNWTKNYDSDIAVMILEEKVQITDTVIPICLWEKSDERKANGIIVGWGKSEGPADHENKPRELELSILSNENCYQKYSFFALIGSTNTFCAGSDENSGPCRGK